MRFAFLLLSIALSVRASTQMVIWAEEFENQCVQNCPAGTYIGVNGAWSTAALGTNGSCANKWFVSCQENGNPVGTCGSGCGNNETLHIGNDATCTSPNSCFFCPSGDCGAAYDASCPPGVCAICCSCQSSQTDVRAQSPPINLTGWSNMFLRFHFIEGGVGTTDNAVLDYYDGTVWATLADMPKSPLGSCGAQGTWTIFSIALPASANNNPNVRVGFRWVNDDDGSGTDPSIAIDDIEIFAPYIPTGTGLVVNELSNGPAGNQEYIELAAVALTCNLDIRGIKVDDNNGVTNNGFGTLMNGSGVSVGHIRFSNAAQWANVPTGSLILIYNNADVNPLVPAVDPSDLAPHDSIYILPANSPLLEGCGIYPDGLVTGTYPTCAFGASSWTWIGLRDQGDAGQTRNAQGRYFHGISYGPNLQNMNPGGLDALRITTASGPGNVLWFNGGNYRQAVNFGAGAVAGNETPGAANNATNLAWLKSLRCIALPIELLSFDAENLADRVRLHWATATEENSSHFVIERSADGAQFEPIGYVDAAGNSHQRADYVHDDIAPLSGVSYYRLLEFDLDGAAVQSQAIAVVRRGNALVSIGCNEAGELVAAPGTAPLPWSLVDELGRSIAQGVLNGSSVIGRVPSGVSLLVVGEGIGTALFRVIRTPAGTWVSALP